MFFEGIGERTRIQVCHGHMSGTAVPDDFSVLLLPGGEDEAENQTLVVLPPYPCVTSPEQLIANLLLLSSEDLALPAQTSARGSLCE